jgi:hypothetical protein
VTSPATATWHEPSTNSRPADRRRHRLCQRRFRRGRGSAAAADAR